MNNRLVRGETVSPTMTNWFHFMHQIYRCSIFSKHTVCIVAFLYAVLQEMKGMFPGNLPVTQRTARKVSVYTSLNLSLCWESTYQKTVQTNLIYLALSSTLLFAVQWLALGIQQPLTPPPLYWCFSPRDWRSVISVKTDNSILTSTPLWSFLCHSPSHPKFLCLPISPKLAHLRLPACTIFPFWECLSALAL